METNGDLLGRYNHIQCTLPEGHTAKPIPVYADECAEFVTAVHIRRRTHLYYMGMLSNFIFIFILFLC